MQYSGGQPVSTSQEPDQQVLSFSKQESIVEMEFDDKHYLKRFNKDQKHGAISAVSSRRQAYQISQQKKRTNRFHRIEGTANIAAFHQTSQSPNENSDKTNSL